MIWLRLWTLYWVTNRHRHMAGGLTACSLDELSLKGLCSCHLAFVLSRLRPGPLLWKVTLARKLTRHILRNGEKRPSFFPWLHSTLALSGTSMTAKRKVFWLVVLFFFWLLADPSFTLTHFLTLFGYGASSLTWYSVIHKKLKSGKIKECSRQLTYDKWALEIWLGWLRKTVFNYIII